MSDSSSDSNDSGDDQKVEKKIEIVEEEAEDEEDNPLPEKPKVSDEKSNAARSRSRSKSKSNSSGSDRKEKSPVKNKEKSAEKSKSRSKSIGESEVKERSRSRGREEKPGSKENERQKSKSKDQSKERSGSREAKRERSRSGGKKRGKSASRERSGSRDDKRERSRSGGRKRRKSASRERSGSKDKRARPGSRDRKRRERSGSRTRRGERSRSRNRRGGRSGSRDNRKRDRSGSRPQKRDRSGSRDKRRRSRSRSKPKADAALPVKKKNELLTTKTGGAYIPPARLRLMQQNITDKASEAYQRLAWEALKKSINGLINKVNSPNIAVIVRELFAENIVRGRGLLCQSVIQAQTASPTFTHVYAALAAIINTKFPNIGELLLKRLILNFKRGFKRNDKTRCTSSVRFIGHMVNQQVAHEVLSLEILTLLLENPTDDSAEVAITFLKEVGQKLTEVSPRGIHAIFERLRHVLHESTLDKRTQYMIEVMFQVRKDGFKDNPSIPEELDLVEEDDQFTHMITLDDATGGEEILNVFKHDTNYEENENKYGAIKAELLEEDSDKESGSGSGSDSDSDSDDEGGDAPKAGETIVDATETNLIGLRRTIYLTIQSALDFEEAVHKLLKLNIKPGQESELCHMIIDCCAQQRTYEKFFGLMGQRFCQVTKTYQEPFASIFIDTYNTVHRLETGKLRNVAKFYSHLLYTDAIPWGVLSVIKLNEDDTTSSSRIFIKILFQELAEFMGLAKLVDRTRDNSLQEAWEGLLPRDNPRDTRFAINFFTSIGLGGVTEDLRAHLKTAPKPTAVVAPMVRQAESSSSSSSDSSSSSESEDEKERKRKKKKRKEGGGADKRRQRSESNLGNSRRDQKRRSGDRNKRRSVSKEIKREKSVSAGNDRNLKRRERYDRDRPNSPSRKRERYERDRSASQDRRRDEPSLEKRRGRERSPAPEKQRGRDRSSTPEKRRGRDRSPTPEKRRGRDQSSTPEKRRVRDRSSTPEKRRGRDRSSSPQKRRERDMSTTPEKRRGRDRSSTPEKRREKDRSASPRKRSNYERTERSVSRDDQRRRR